MKRESGIGCGSAGRGRAAIIRTRHRRSPPMQDDAPSKTELKKQMHALQALGARLVEPERGAARCDRPAGASCATRCSRRKRIRSREGRRRQLQYIGKLMREIDPAPIRALLAVWDGQSRRGDRGASSRRALAGTPPRRRRRAHGVRARASARGSAAAAHLRARGARRNGSRAASRGTSAISSACSAMPTSAIDDDGLAIIAAQ